MASCLGDQFRCFYCNSLRKSRRLPIAEGLIPIAAWPQFVCLRNGPVKWTYCFTKLRFTCDEISSKELHEVGTLVAQKFADFRYSSEEEFTSDY